MKKPARRKTRRIVLGATIAVAALAALQIQVTARDFKTPRAKEIISSLRHPSSEFASSELISLGDLVSALSKEFKGITGLVLMPDNKHFVLTDSLYISEYECLDYHGPVVGEATVPIAEELAELVVSNGGMPIRFKKGGMIILFS